MGCHSSLLYRPSAGVRGRWTAPWEPARATAADPRTLTLAAPRSDNDRVTDVWISGAGMTRFGKRDETLPDLITEAAYAALADAGIDQPDALVVGAMNPEEFTGDGNFASLINTHLGLTRLPALRVETATSSGLAAFFTGFAAVAARLYRNVLVVGAEKMSHIPTPRVSEIIGRSIDPHERRYGTTMPALAGLITRAAMHRHGLTLREISQVAVKNHANAARNPYAHFQEPVTLEAVMESRMVADPLRLFHCCPISDGAAAVVLTSERSAVRVAGIGQGTDSIAIRYRADLTSFRATQVAAQAAYRMAGFGPERVDVAELHDAFSSFEIISLEDTGLMPAGKAGRATLEGETALDGRLPVSPSGGLKARGHPLAATGIGQVVELCWQLRGKAGARQVSARVGLAQSIGGLATNNWILLLEAAR
jgi:acetyl-CoA C-acetyltransferase